MNIDVDIAGSGSPDRGLRPKPHARAWLGLTAALLVCAALLSCTRDERPTPAGETTRAPSEAPAGARGLKADIVQAPGGNDEVPALVQAESARARAEGRTLVVYVGATWCEPCQRLHDAIEAGELDAAFPGLRLLEFDLDRDAERLDRAGYGSKLIPLLVVPGPDGRASDLRTEGSVKGERAVEVIVPRLRAILAQASERKS